jgi:hypothetical protein
MIISISKYQDENQKELEIKKKLIEDFNRLAKEQKSKYKLFLEYEYRIKLIKPFLWNLNFGNFLGENRIFYILYSDEFYFYEGIDKKIFEDIKPILDSEKLKQKFKIEIIE